MERLKFEHENIRTLASRELFKFGIKIKLKKLPSKKYSPKKKCYRVDINHMEAVDVKIGKDEMQVPKVFYKLVEFVKPDLVVEGIFRVEGSKVKERVLVQILDNDSEIPEDTDTITACAVMKVFLRNLPDQLIPGDIVPWFMAAAKLSDHSADAIGLCVLLLPLRNLYLLVYLMQFFSEVASHQSENKMGAYNLAVVTGPNIFKDHATTAKEMAQNNQIFINISKILIEKSKTLGQVPACLTDKLEALHEENNAAMTSGGLGKCSQRYNTQPICFYHDGR